ncbi:MAG TPA: Fic family protein [Woeseiaceae bacterium]|nr:Fic family protein [Woeseiaceae bacterium]
MDEPIWLTRRTIAAIREDQIREHGGGRGMRHEGSAQSALARPRQKWAYEGETVDLADLAAAYAYDFVASHAFVDGNKRVGSWRRTRSWGSTTMISMCRRWRWWASCVTSRLAV